MIYVTTAANDKDLLEALQSRDLAIPQGDLPADFAFQGQWDGGRPLWACGDRKHLGDLLQCIRDGRHVRQLQRCREAGYEIQYLVVEGAIIKHNITGNVAIRKGKNVVDHPAHIPFSELTAYLEEVALYGGVQVRLTLGLTSTVSAILQAYKTLAVPPDHHKVLHKVYSIPHTGAADMLGRRPSLLRRIAKELPGVGWELSQRVEDHFSSVGEMLTAAPSLWEDIEGIGSTKAQRITGAITDTHFRTTARRDT